MPPEPPAKEEIKPNEETMNLLKEINDKVSAPAKPQPESQPKSDPMVDYNARKADIMKKMNWTEDQFAFHEQEKASAAAPIMKDMSLMKIERAHKDYDKLKDAFEKEIQKYETQYRRMITPDLAEEVFFMVKGREISAGRYKTDPSDSQPKGGPRDSRPRISTQPTYSEAPGVVRDGGDGDEAPQVSDREKEYIRIFGRAVTAESYVKMREEKKQGIRAIADKSFRSPEIDRKTANPADRELLSHWEANDGNMLVGR